MERTLRPALHPAGGLGWHLQPGGHVEVGICPTSDSNEWTMASMAAGAAGWGMFYVYLKKLRFPPYTVFCLDVTHSPTL